MTNKVFDPNEGAKEGGMRLPSTESYFGAGGTLEHVTSEADFLAAIERPYGQAAGEPNSKQSWLSKLPALVKEGARLAVELAKATIEKANLPPQMFTFARISYMPDPANEGILQWPGIAPEALRKVVHENIAPQLIIGMRCDDVLRYSTESTQAWRPGWHLEPISKGTHPPAEDKNVIQEAISFLNNSCIGLTNAEARERDQNHLTDFQHFLAAIVRDTFTFDGIAVWTDMSVEGKIKAYSALPAGNIRLAGPGGYKGNKKHYAVAVDEGNKIIHVFTRDELTFYIRNPRTDPGSMSYGYSETEVGIRLVQGFQNAIDLNIDTFNRNATPNGILVVTGASQRQLDLLNRMWSNLKKGITKQWALPVVGLPDKDSKFEILDLSAIKGMEAYYQDAMNIFMGAFCTIFRFPVRRLGYRISGNKTPTEPGPDSGAKLVDEDDPGLPPLLTHIENLINQYLVWPNWPQIRFCFSGKDPKEDARGYEFKKNAMTWSEARREVILDDLTKQTTDPEIKKFLEVMQLCPLDPNLSGSFQSLASVVLNAMFGTEGGGEGEPGNRMQSKKDPAASEDHGHRAGVRRNSAAEGGSE